MSDLFTPNDPSLQPSNTAPLSTLTGVSVPTPVPTPVVPTSVKVNVDGLPYTANWTKSTPPTSQDMNRLTQVIRSSRDHQVAAYGAKDPDTEAAVRNYTQKFLSDPDNTSIPNQILKRVSGLRPALQPDAIPAGLSPIGRLAIMRASLNVPGEKLSNSQNLATAAARANLPTEKTPTGIGLGGWGGWPAGTPAGPGPGTQTNLTPDVTRYGIPQAQAALQSRTNQLLVAYKEGTAELAARSQMTYGDQDDPYVQKTAQDTLALHQHVQNIESQLKAQGVTPPEPVSAVEGIFDALNRTASALVDVNESGSKDVAKNRADFAKAYANAPPSVVGNIIDRAIGQQGTYKTAQETPGLLPQLATGLTSFAEPSNLATLAVAGPALHGLGAIGKYGALALFGAPVAKEAIQDVQKGDYGSAAGKSLAFLAPMAAHGAISKAENAGTNPLPDMTVNHAADQQMQNNPQTPASQPMTDAMKQAYEKAFSSTAASVHGNGAEPSVAFVQAHEAGLKAAFEASKTPEATAPEQISSQMQTSAATTPTAPVPTPEPVKSANNNAFSSPVAEDVGKSQAAGLGNVPSFMRKVQAGLPISSFTDGELAELQRHAKVEAMLRMDNRVEGDDTPWWKLANEVTNEARSRAEANFQPTHTFNGTPVLSLGETPNGMVRARNLEGQVGEFRPDELKPIQPSTTAQPAPIPTPEPVKPATAATLPQPIAAGDKVMGYITDPETKLSRWEPVTVGHMGTEPHGIVVGTDAGGNGHFFKASELKPLPQGETNARTITPTETGKPATAPAPVVPTAAGQGEVGQEPQGTNAATPEANRLDQIEQEAKAAAMKAATPATSPDTAKAESQVIPQPVSAPVQTTAPHTFPSPSEGTLSPDKIGVYPGMQYKKAGIVDTKAGVTDALKGTDTYDVDQGGRLTTWKDPEGKDWVVNGHHRLELAQRADSFVKIGPDGNPVEVPRELPVNILDSKDGWTMEAARARGALENIRDGKGTALDALDVMQHLGITPDRFNDVGFSMTGEMGKNVAGLMELDPIALSRVQNGEVPEQVAAGIGAVKGLTPEAQRGAIDEAARSNIGTYNKGQGLANEYLQDQRDGTLAGGGAGGQGDLFGGEFNSADSTRGIRVDLKDAVTNQMASERRGLLKPTDAQLQEGEHIDVEGRKAAASAMAESPAALKERMRLVYGQDAVKAEVNRLAGEVGNGKLSKSQATAELAAAVRPHIGKSVAELADTGSVQVNRPSGTNGVAQPEASPDSGLFNASEGLRENAPQPAGNTSEPATTEPAGGGSTPQSVRERLATAEENARQNLKDSMNRANMNPEFLYHAAKLGAVKIARGALNFADWSKAMVDDLGEAVRPHLDQIYKAAQAFHDNDLQTMLGKQPIDRSAQNASSAPVEPAQSQTTQELRTSEPAETAPTPEQVQASNESNREAQQATAASGVPEGTPVAEPKAETPAVAPTTAQEEAKPAEATSAPKPEDALTGGRNAITEWERQQMGLPEVDRQPYTTMAEAAKLGREAVDANDRDEVFKAGVEGAKAIAGADGEPPIDPVKLAADVAAKPRVVSAREEGALVYHKAQLINESEMLRKQMNATDDPSRLSELGELMRANTDKLDLNQQALVKGGRELSAAFNARKMFLKPDYTFAESSQLWRANNGGAELPPAKAAELDSLYRQLDAAKADLSKSEEARRVAEETLQKHLSEATSNREVAEITKEVKDQQRVAGRVRQRQKVEEEWTGLKQELRSALGMDKPKSGSGTLQMSLVPSEQIHALDEADLKKVAPILGKMARNLVERGTVKAGEIVDSIHAEMSDVGLTKRQIADAISGYGNKATRTTSQATTDFNNARKVMRLTSMYEDALKGEPVQKGTPPGKPSPEVVAAKKLLDAELKRQGLSQTGQRQTSVEARQEATEKALQKRIDDLTTRIANKDFSKPAGQTTPSTPAIDALKAQRDKLQDQYNKMKPPESRQMSEADRLTRIKDNQQKTIDQLDNQLKTGQAPPAKQAPVAYDAEANANKAKIDSLRAQIDAATKPAPGFLDKMVALRRAGFLIPVRTLNKILTQHVGMFAADEVSHIPASMVDYIRSAITGEDRQVGNMSLKGMALAAAKAKETLPESIRILKEGEGALHHEQARTMSPDNPYGQMSRTFSDSGGVTAARGDFNSGNKLVDTFVNTASRTHGAMYHTMQTYALARSIYEQANVAAINEAKGAKFEGYTRKQFIDQRTQHYFENPSSTMVINAIANAREATLTNENLLSSGVAGAKAGLTSTVKDAKTGQTVPRFAGGKAAASAIDLALPFPKVPANAVARAVDYTGVPAVGTGASMIYKAMRGVKVPDAQAARFAQLAGRGALGAGLFAAGMAAYHMKGNFHVSGTLANQKERKENDVTGNVPGAVELLGQERKIGNFGEPFSIFTLGASTAQAMDDATKRDREGRKPSQRYGEAIGNYLADQPLMGVGETYDRAKSEGVGPALLSELATFFPGGNLTSDVAASFDPLKRDITGRSSNPILSYVPGAILNRIPVARETLPPKVNARGQGIPETLGLIDPFQSRVPGGLPLSEEDRAKARELQREKLREKSSR